MPELRRPLPAWLPDAGAAQVLDPETAVKDGILGSGGGGGGGACGVAVDKVDLRRMIEELDAGGSSDDVPGVFICPISLDPMTDPVTLCTGQTYERGNILRWLAVGRPTCPTTMQELWDDGVTPNRTLLTLIHAWFTHRYHRFKKLSDDVHGRAADALASLKKLKGQARVNALRDLRRLLAAHPSANQVITSGPAAGVALLLSLLGPLTTHAAGSEVVAILAGLPLDADAKKALAQPPKISLLVDMLNEGTIQTKINCTKLIAAISSEAEDAVSSLPLLVGILRLIKDKRHPAGIAAGLSLLRSITSFNKALTMVVSIGSVPQLIDLVPTLTLEPLESALSILDHLSSTPEGRMALKECPQTIPITVRLLMRVSEACTQSALSILWELCKVAPNECGSLAVEAGLAAKLLLVIQSGCSAQLKQRAVELLKLCSLNYSVTHFISKCKLTRTIQ